jgi:hypothetical protein
MIMTQWYEEGKNAKISGLTLEDCPYKEYSYGYSQWIKGYNS